MTSSRSTSGRPTTRAGGSAGGIGESPSAVRRAVELFGVDPARGMIEVASSAGAGDERLRFSIGVAEQLAYAAALRDR
ncbi:MAG: hypothetical protein ACLP36_12905 [Acidimicrobiales bacterium]